MTIIEILYVSTCIWNSLLSGALKYSDGPAVFRGLIGVDGAFLFCFLLIVLLYLFLYLAFLLECTFLAHYSSLQRFRDQGT